MTNTPPHPWADDYSETEMEEIEYHMEHEPSTRAEIAIKSAIKGSKQLDLSPPALRRAIISTHMAVDVYGLQGKPSTVAAGVVYFISRINSSTPSHTQAVVGDVFGCTGSSVSRLYNEFISEIDRHIPGIQAVDYYETMATDPDIPVTAEQLGLDDIEQPWVFRNERMKKNAAV